MTGRTLIEFFSQCQHAPGGHLLWVGPCNREGYGVFYGGKEYAKLAHRFALIAMTPGMKAPEGMWAMHDESCPKNCVAIGHLKWGTPSENYRSAWEAGKVDRRKLSKLTDQEREELQCLVDSGVPTIDATEAYGVHKGYLSMWRYHVRHRRMMVPESRVHKGA